MEGLGLWGKSAAHFLDGPRFFAACGLPEQLRRFLGTALGDERLVEGFFKACAALRLAGWIAGLSGPPFRGLVAGNTGFELCISLHNAGLLYWVCSSVLMGGNGVNHRSPGRMVAQVDLEIIWMAQGAPCLSAQPVPGVLPGVCPREHKASVKVCSCLGRPFRLLLCPLLQRGMVRSSAPSWNWLAQSTGDCDSLPACRHRDRAPQTPGSKGVLPGWPNGMNVFGTGLGTLDPGGYPVRSSGDSQPHWRGKFERHPRWPATLESNTYSGSGQSWAMNVTIRPRDRKSTRLNSSHLVI